MKRFLLILLALPICLFSIQRELYIRPGVSWESCHWDLQDDDFLFNAFNKLKWDNTVALLTPGVVYRADPDSCFEGLYLRVEVEWILANRTSSFKGTITENNPPTFFSNTHSPKGKLSGNGALFELGWQAWLTPDLCVTPSMGVYSKIRRFHCHPGAFDSPEEEDVASFQVNHFSDRKNMGGFWAGLEGEYFPCQDVRVIGSASYVVGLINGHTKWSSAEIFNDGFAFVCQGEIANLRRRWHGAKVKLGVDYLAGENCSIGLRGFYDFLGKKSSPDDLAVYQNTLTSSGTSLGETVLYKRIDSKIQWQAFTLAVQLTYIF